MVLLRNKRMRRPHTEAGVLYLQELKMIADFRKTFTRRSIEDTASDELYEAEKSLLIAQTKLEFAKATLDAETATLAHLRPEGRYTLVAEGGLRTASQADRASLTGSQWRALQKALDEAASYTATLRACAPVAAELKPQLRAVLQYHCGSPVLRTRQLMMDLQSL